MPWWALALLLTGCSGIRMEVCQRVTVSATLNHDLGDVKAGSCRVYELREIETP